MNKYGIYISDEPYYGLDASWEQYVNGDGEPSREQIVKCITSEVDYLSKFIKPSVLLDFAKALEDPLTGEELYSRLCENLSYVESFKKKAFALSTAFYSSFFTEVFGESIPYDIDDSCHLLLFPKQENDANLSWLIRDHESFKSWFLSSLSKNKGLYSVLVEGAGENGVVKADVVAKLKTYLESLSYHKKQMADVKKRIKEELSRINDSMIFEGDDKKVIKKAKGEPE